MITIDGLQFDFKCKITRTAEVKASEVSGLMLDKSYFNDVLGTFMRYEIAIEVPPWARGDYDSFYQVITEPVDGYTVILPYGQGTITLTARIEAVSDEYERMPGGRVVWKGTTFSIIANHPSREQTLSGAITRGITPLPNVAEPQIGDSYTYTASGWVPAQTYADADDTAY